MVEGYMEVLGMVRGLGLYRLSGGGWFGEDTVLPMLVSKVGAAEYLKVLAAVEPAGLY
jgi:hypothetical protein